MADHFSKSENLPLCFYIGNPPPVLHPLCCGFLLLKQGRMCLYNLWYRDDPFLTPPTECGGISGAAPSPWGFTLLIQMPTLCKPHATPTAPACCVIAWHGHSYSSLVTTAWLSPWPCMSFFGSQTPWEYYDSKIGHLFAKGWIIIRLPHNLWFFHFLSNDIQNTLCVQKEKGQEGWKEEAQEFVRGQTLAEMCWRTSQAGRVRAVLSILSIVKDSRTV